MKKKCTKCKKTKTLNEFYKKKSHKDGYAYRCKTCTKKYRKKYARKESRKKQCTRCKKYKLYNKFNKSKAFNDGLSYRCRVCTKELFREKNWSKEKIERYEKKEAKKKERNKRILKCQKIYKEQNPEKIRCHRIVAKAVKDGTLIKLEYCEICNKTNCTIYGHHDAYSKPLDVVWCCYRCHLDIHKALRKNKKRKALKK